MKFKFKTLAFNWDFTSVILRKLSTLHSRPIELADRAICVRIQSVWEIHNAAPYLNRKSLSLTIVKQIARDSYKSEGCD